MSTEAGLLAAILADPDEDTPRLAYADFLDEQANDPPTPRAEFIRVQCELAQLEAQLVRFVRALAPSQVGLPDGHEARRIHLRDREQKLLKGQSVEHPGQYVNKYKYVNKYLWCGGDRGVLWNAVIIWDNVTFDRGFVDVLRVTAADWLANDDAIRAAHPVRKVVLTTSGASKFFARYAAKYDCGARVEALLSEVLADLYPGIEFELPAPNPYEGMSMHAVG